METSDPLSYRRRRRLHGGFSDPRPAGADGMLPGMMRGCIPLRLLTTEAGKDLASNHPIRRHQSTGYFRAVCQLTWYWKGGIESWTHSFSDQNRLIRQVHFAEVENTTTTRWFQSLLDHPEIKL